MIELVLLVVLSVFTERLLRKRYKIASIAHSVLFVFLFIMFMFTTDFKPIQNFMISWMGKVYYESLYDAMTIPVKALDYGISGVLAIDIAMFVLIPLVSVVAIINEEKEHFKGIKIIYDYFRFLLVNLLIFFAPHKSYEVSKKHIYLVFGRLLN